MSSLNLGPFSPAGEELLTFEAFPIFPDPRHSIRLSEVDLKENTESKEVA